MPNPRELRLTIEVTDDGTDDDYARIMRALDDLGARVIDEREVR